MKQYAVAACFALVLILHVAPSQATLVGPDSPGFSILELVSPTSIVFAGSGSEDTPTPTGDTIPFSGSAFAAPFIARLFDGNDGCQSSDFDELTPGYVALLARGPLGCLFQDKALHAAAAGASGLIVYDIGINFIGGNICPSGPVCPDIAGMLVKQSVGQALLGALVSGQGIATVRFGVVSPVPEPATLALVCAALIGALAVRRRKPVAAANRSISIGL